jgi:hypothetical protein
MVKMNSERLLPQIMEDTKAFTRCTSENFSNVHLWGFRVPLTETGIVGSTVGSYVESA